LSSSITEHFQRYQIPLDEKADIQVDQAGRNWTIRDGNSIYTIRKENQALGVYSEVKEPALTLGSGASWAATTKGLYHKNEDQWKFIPSTWRLAAGSFIQAITQTQKGRVWIGTSDGVYIYDPDIALPPQRMSMLGHLSIKVLLSVSTADAIEYVWIGTDKGLYKHDHKSVTVFPDSERSAITALAWDSSAKVLWVGTEAGLFSVLNKGNKWESGENWNIQDSGLASDRITALAVCTSTSDVHILYVGTPCGLSCYTYSYKEGFEL
jgi:ligand-binding sensor domain-containing protein